MSLLVYLLDTNILSHMIKDQSGLVARKALACGAERLCTSIIVAGELRYGAAKRG